MRMRNGNTAWGRGLLALVPAVILCACSPNGPGEEPPDQDPITVEHPATAGVALATTAATGMNYFDLGNDLVVANCLSFSGDQSDNDGDGIPTLITITLSGCTITDGGLTTTLSGEIILRDEDPNLPTFTFAMGYDVTAVVTDSSSTILATGTLETSVTGGPGGGTNYALTVLGAETAQTTIDGEPVSLERTHAWIIDYGSGGAWVPGVPIQNGTTTVAGDWQISANGSPTENAVLATTAPLNVNPACGLDLFDAGTVTATWTDANDETQVLVVDYTGCGSVDVTLNGAPHDPAGIVLPVYHF